MRAIGEFLAYLLFMVFHAIRAFCFVCRVAGLPGIIVNGSLWLHSQRSSILVYVAISFAILAFGFFVKRALIQTESRMSDESGLGTSCRLLRVDPW